MSAIERVNGNWHPPTGQKASRGRRRRYQEEILDPEEPSASEAPAPPPNTGTTTAIDGGIYELATKYVAQYATHSGRNLTQEQRDAMIADVSRFYSDPSREGRLSKVIIA